MAITLLCYFNLSTMLFVHCLLLARDLLLVMAISIMGHPYKDVCKILAIFAPPPPSPCPLVSPGHVHNHEKYLSSDLTNTHSALIVIDKQ